MNWSITTHTIIYIYSNEVWKFEVYKRWAFLKIWIWIQFWNTRWCIKFVNSCNDDGNHQGFFSLLRDSSVYWEIENQARKATANDEEKSEKVRQ